MKPRGRRRAGRAREFAAAFLAGGVAWALAGPRPRGPEPAAAPRATIPARTILPAWHPHVLPGEGWSRLPADSGAFASSAPRPPTGPNPPGAPDTPDGARVAGSAPRMVIEWFGPPVPAGFDAVVRMRSARAAEVELSLPHAPGWTRAELSVGEIAIPLRLRTEHPSEVLHLEIVATRPERPPALELIEVRMAPLAEPVTAPATRGETAPARAED